MFLPSVYLFIFPFLRTGELIGCVTVDLSQTQVNKGMAALKPAPHTSVAVIHYDTGDLIVNSEDDGFLIPSNNRLSDIGVTSEEEVLEQLKAIVEETLRNGWTPRTVKEVFSRAAVNCSFGILFSYPVPVPPDEYDPEFRPRNLVIQIASESIFAPISDFGDSIDQEIRDVALVTTAIGIFGLVLTLAFVWCIARMLTEPLIWIEYISGSILKHADKDSGVFLDRTFETSRWSPNTEIIDLVASFKKMIEGFSGDRPPSVAEKDYAEINNSITWQSDFCQLYEKGLEFMKPGHSNTSAATPQTEEESRAYNDEEIGAVPPTSAVDEPVWQSDFNPAFKRSGYEIRKAHSLSFVAGRGKESDLKNQIDERKSMSVVPAPPKQNIGRNIPVASSQQKTVPNDAWFRVSRSKLFRWILVSLVTPLILATTAICILVTTNIISTVPAWVDILASESLLLSQQALASLVVLKCRLIEEMLAEPMRDLYLLTRVANWVHAGAVPRSNSFTELDYATEECNNYTRYGCPLFDIPDRFPCPCDWGEAQMFDNEPCTGSKSSNSRPLQKKFYACQSKGVINQFTGERTTAFGMIIDKYPNETEWWGDPMELPGVLSYDSNPELSTTYSKTRISSSFAVVEFPLFNYAAALGRQKHHLGTYQAYEAEGLFTGFSGCSYNFANYAYFVSSPENHAATIRPDLCPVGEYGYDPRCRPWYEETQNDYEENEAFIHLTPPYLYEDTRSIGLSAVSPIVDHETDVMIGEVLLDFIPMGMWEAFERIDKPVSFMISVEEDVFGGNTIIGPDRSEGWSSSKITDLLFKFDEGYSQSRRIFEDTILESMKKGGVGTEPFRRNTEDGYRDDLTVSFHPVYHRFLRPIDSRNMTRGVDVESRQVYSIAIANYDNDMYAPFRDVKDDMVNDLKRLAIIDIVSAVMVAFLFIAFAFRVSIICLICLRILVAFSSHFVSLAYWSRFLFMQRSL